MLRHLLLALSLACAPALRADDKPPAEPPTEKKDEKKEPDKEPPPKDRKSVV